MNDLHPLAVFALALLVIIVVGCTLVALFDWLERQFSQSSHTRSSGRLDCANKHRRRSEKPQ